MLVRVNPSSATPLADQIAAEIRGAVARGEVVAGERLASARELAGALEVNMHTVLRAYAALRDDGLIELRRGRGAVVRRGVSAERTHLSQLAAEFARQARRLGVDEEEMVTMIREAGP